MSSPIFIDTNILLYAIDGSDSKRKARARKIIKQIVRDRTGVISVQVAQEFFVIATRKLKIEPSIVRKVLERFEMFRFVPVELATVQEAVDCSVMSKISFWDALIVCTARSAGCKHVYTEDLNHLQLIRGVRVVNPFLGG